MASIGLGRHFSAPCSSSRRFQPQSRHLPAEWLSNNGILLISSDTKLGSALSRRKSPRCRQALTSWASSIEENSNPALEIKVTPVSGRENYSTEWVLLYQSATAAIHGYPRFMGSPFLIRTPIVNMSLDQGQRDGPLRFPPRYAPPVVQGRVNVSQDARRKKTCDGW